MASPIVSNFYLATGEESTALHESTAFVQIISFPNSHSWIWIGDQSGAQQNLALALGPPKCHGGSNVMSSHILNSSNPDEASIHAKGFAERISKKLGGKPVYLTCNLNNTVDDQVQNILEKQILGLIKTDPHVFGM